MCALVVAGKPDVTDLAMLFLPVDASDVEPSVDARRLHQLLGVGKVSRTWIAGRVEAPGFVEDTDYCVCFPNLESKECGVMCDDGNGGKVIREGRSVGKDFPRQGRGGHNVKEYSLTMDMAKHLALLERNGCFNATEMYASNSETQALIDAMESVTGIPATLLVVTKQHGAASEHGTWVHPKVAINLAHKQPGALQLEGTHRPETPAPVCALVVPDGPKQEVTDLAALFLPVAAGEEEPWVDARRLHQSLGSKRQFSDWLKRRAVECQLVENEDYGIVHNSVKNPQSGRPTKDYWLTMDAAKGFSMMERNAQGKLCRDYFVACEKELQRRQMADKVPAIELKQSKDGSTYLAGLLGEQAVKVVTVEAALKEATDRADKAEKALGDVVVQPGLVASVAAMGLNLGTEKIRADHWEAMARDQVSALQAWQNRARAWENDAMAAQEKIKTMVPRLIPTDTMSMTGFADVYPELGLGRNQLKTFLRARGVLYTGPHKNGGVEGQTETLLSTSHIDSGYFGYKPTERGFTNADAEPYTKKFLGPPETPKGVPSLLKEIDTHELLLVYRTRMDLANSVDPDDAVASMVFPRIKGKWVAELGSVPYDRLRSALTSDDAAAFSQSTGSASVHEHGRL